MGLRKMLVGLISVSILTVPACSNHKSVRTHYACQVDVGGVKHSLAVNVDRATSAQATLVTGSPLRGYRSPVHYLVKFSVLGSATHRRARIAALVDGGVEYGTRALDEGTFPFVGSVGFVTQRAVPIAYDCPRPT